ncbi:hypothetical protein SUDANB105_08162 (plasmid) [Streptomyces sp. enrichment culture]
MPGAFALTADRGQLAFETFGNDDAVTGANPEVDLGAEFTARYGRAEPTRYWANSNLSPHFPHAARIWAATWQERSGRHVDGAVALDPTVLSRLLRVTGAGRLADGAELTADNVLDLTERTGYARYPDDAERKAFLLDVARTATGTLQDAFRDPRRLPGLVKAAYDDAAEGRLKMWSAREDEQRLLATRPWGGTFPQEPGRRGRRTAEDVECPGGRATSAGHTALGRHVPPGAGALRGTRRQQRRGRKARLLPRAGAELGPRPLYVSRTVRHRADHPHEHSSIVRTSRVRDPAGRQAVVRHPAGRQPAAGLVLRQRGRKPHGRVPRRPPRHGRKRCGAAAPGLHAGCGTARAEHPNPHAQTGRADQRPRAPCCGASHWSHHCGPMWPPTRPAVTDRVDAAAGPGANVDWGQPTRAALPAVPRLFRAPSAKVA